MLIFNTLKPICIVSCIFSICIFSSCANKNRTASVGTSKDIHKVVCKKYMPTNSRIPIKDCRTQGEWDEIQRTAQESLDKTTQPMTNNPQGL